ncbi:MAG: hypothetical protein ACKOXZ_06740, partial [Polynucleobacter victoriensis]
MRKQDLAKQLEGSYGLALLSFKQQKNIDAENYLQKSKTLMQAMSANGSPIQRWSLSLETTAIELMYAKSQYEQGIKQIANLKAFYPQSRSLSMLLVEGQLKTGQHEQAIELMYAKSQ